MSSEFWAAVAGSLVGGLIALMLQIWSAWQSDNRRKEDLKYKENSTIYNLYYKVILIHSNITTIRDSIEAQFEKTDPDQANNPSSFLLPIPNPSDSIVFSDQEMGLLMQKDKSLFNQIVMTDQCHNSLIPMIKRYDIERAELWRGFPADMNGTVGTITLTKDQMREKMPAIVGLNILIDQLRHRLKQDQASSEISMLKISKYVKDNIDSSLDVQIKTNNSTKVM
jgi:hypothetical protein